jgi:glucose/arabinose dehydrogenase
VLLEDLPYNGRSEGTLTVLADGRMLYETTGSLVGQTADTGTVQPGSGTLFSIDLARLPSQLADNNGRALSPDEQAVVATGTKHAYSHATYQDRLLVTEIGDGPGLAPPDELNSIALAPAATAPDLGWPRCPSDRPPSKPGCSSTVDPIAVFPRDSTPTSVVVIGDDAYVALFVTGTVVRVPLKGWKPGDPPVRTETVITGLEGPHSLLAEPDGSLLVSEHLAGRIVRRSVR